MQKDLFFILFRIYLTIKIFSSPEASLHKNHEKTLKIGTSGIRIWGIGIRLPKWSEYIRISDNSDIRTSTLHQCHYSSFKYNFLLVASKYK